MDILPVISDKEKERVRFQAYFSKGYPLNATEQTIDNLVEKVAQAQRDDCHKRLREWGEEECPHVKTYGPGTEIEKHACGICWKELIDG